jgi:hypothetical protein
MGEALTAYRRTAASQRGKRCAKWKVRFGRELRPHSTTTNPRIAERLAMGPPEVRNLNRENM